MVLSMKFKLFGRLKKEEPAKPAYDFSNDLSIGGNQQQSSSSRPLPEDRVTSLLSQGLSEPEMIRVLKEEGYSFQEIDSGITNVLKQRVSENPSAIDMPFQGAPMEDLSPVFRPNPADVMRSDIEQRSKAQVMEEMEEVIETLIEEKFSSVLKELESMDNKVMDLKEKFNDINGKIASLESQEKGIGVSEAEKINAINVREDMIEPRITSLEKAFKDIIPNLVDSIRELRETAASSKRRDVSARDFVECAKTETVETRKAPEEEKEEKNEKESIFD